MTPDPEAETEAETEIETETGVAIDRPEPGEASTIADLWVELAKGQRDHGSHLAATANHEPILDSIGHHVADGTLFVARAESGIVGFVMFSIERRLYTVSTTRGTVDNLYVVPERRGEGIGSALLEMAEAALAVEGVDRVSLEALVENDQARRFYESHGYSAHRIEFEKRVETDNSTRQ